METLAAQMRLLALEDMKQRRDTIFQRARSLDYQQNCGPSQKFDSEVQNSNEQSGQSMFKKQQQLDQKLNQQMKNDYNISHQKQVDPCVDHQYKTRRYWKNMFRICDRLVTIPNNLGDYYFASRPYGPKCLMIFNRKAIELLDENGYIIYSHNNPVPHLTGTILEVSYQKQIGKIVIADLISWKTNAFNSVQFEYRNTWLVEHLKHSLTLLSSQLKIEFKIVSYRACNYQNLQIVYNEQPLYVRDGLSFIHKKSYYDPGHNPSCLVWKDEHISPTFQKEYQQNKNISKGIGYINRNGQVKTLENTTLFKVDRNLIRQQVRYVKFTYKGIRKISYMQGEEQLEMVGLKLVGSETDLQGFVNSLSELFYKCSLKNGNGRVTIQDIAGQLM